MKDYLILENLTRKNLIEIMLSQFSDAQCKIALRGFWDTIDYYLTAKLQEEKVHDQSSAEQSTQSSAPSNQPLAINAPSAADISGDKKESKEEKKKEEKNNDQTTTVMRQNTQFTLSSTLLATTTTTASSLINSSSSSSGNATATSVATSGEQKNESQEEKNKANTIAKELKISVTPFKRATIQSARDILNTGFGALIQRYNSTVSMPKRGALNEVKVSFEEILGKPIDGKNAREANRYLRSITFDEKEVMQKPAQGPVQKSPEEDEEYNSAEIRLGNGETVKPGELTSNSG
jgi:hypothetical protein